ncbi:hypothetical protein LUZ60_013613 [Juncus effusus]|nr:hypothetical protein LUZ60_013613 [Juncus effusus]
MNNTTQDLCLMISISFSLVLLAHSQTANTIPSLNSLESTIQNQTFQVLSEGRTGKVYTVQGAENLSGVSGSAIRLRSKAIWIRGVNLGPFIIPSKTFPRPYKRRIALVYQNWGNLSSSYFNATQGYELIAPVMSLLAYDASSLNTSLSNVSRLEITTFGGPIYVNFSKIMSLNGSDTGIKCISFESNGSMRLQGNLSENSCRVNGTGHFAIAIQTRVLGPGQAVVVNEQKGDVKRIWIIGCLIGVIGLILIGLVAIGFVKLARKRRMEEMEREREDGEILADLIVGDSRLPCASMCRTKPIIENESKIKL